RRSSWTEPQAFSQAVAQRLQLSRQALHSAWWPACFLHAASQSLQALAHTAARALRCLLSCSASSARASHSGSMARTVAAHSAIILSPVERLRMQWSRHSVPTRTHSSADSYSSLFAARPEDLMASFSLAGVWPR